MSKKPSKSTRANAPATLIAVAALVFGLGLDHLYPLGLVARVPDNIVRALTMLTGIFASAIAIAAVVSFRRADVSVGPGVPTAFVTTGVLAWTRNPMYLSTLFAMVALAVSFDSDWTLAVLIPCTIVLHYFVVLREEEVLEANFDDAYRAYRNRVPRYIGRPSSALPGYSDAEKRARLDQLIDHFSSGGFTCRNCMSRSKS